MQVATTLKAKARLSGPQFGFSPTLCLDGAVMMRSLYAALRCALASYDS